MSTQTRCMVHGGWHIDVFDVAVGAFENARSQGDWAFTKREQAQTQQGSWRGWGGETFTDRHTADDAVSGWLAVQRYPIEGHGGEKGWAWDGAVAWATGCWLDVGHSTYLWSWIDYSLGETTSVCSQEVCLGLGRDLLGAGVHLVCLTRSKCWPFHIALGC